MKESSDFLENVRDLARDDGHYDFQAYLFVFQALEFTLKRIGRRRHISGQELLEGIKDFAILNFGAMGKTVFDQWGVRESMDFGRMVFSLVEAGLMSKTEGDDISDFAGGFDFDKTFVQNYVPAGLCKQEPPEDEATEENP
ncbi:MAG: hypothetical protein J7M19_02190 [Planctomycetes bacterium]|nr:hypothetical protein [Planctomycetota bacterium]